LVFTQNVSTAINIVASGLELPASGGILLSDREYGSMHWCWERAAAQRGLTIRTFHLPLNARTSTELCDTVAECITTETRLLFFSHVYSANGMVLPARELCALARQRGIISVVDGAHAPVQISLSVDDVDADFYTGNLHKWLLAPIGAGFLVLGKNSLDRLQPLHVSWGYKTEATPDKLDEPDEFGSTPRIRKLEFEGTRDLCPWFVVPDAIEFQASLGFDAIRYRMAELSRHAVERIGELGFTRATPDGPDLRAAMTAFRIPSTVPPQEVRARLWKHHIEVPVMEWPDGAMCRISTHFYNTAEEIDGFMEVAPNVFG
jgi:isopenicillin-N epimerase